MTTGNRALLSPLCSVTLLGISLVFVLQKESAMEAREWVPPLSLGLDSVARID